MFTFTKYAQTIYGKSLNLPSFRTELGILAKRAHILLWLDGYALTTRKKLT